MKRGPPKRKAFSPEKLREAERAAVKRKALRTLKKAQALADEAGVVLSEWEGEFLGSVAERVTTYGRAFADPEKGGPGQAFSTLQARKLKEIAAKASGEVKPPRRFGRRPPAKPE